MSKHGLEAVSVVWWFMLILSNLHNLPCICVKMAPTGPFFHFLVIFRIKGKKGSLAHDKTLFGRLFCCLVIYATLHNFLCICGEAENPRMTIGVQSTNEERKCATRHNVFTLPPQDQPYVPTAQGPLNGKRATAAYIIQMTKMDMQMRLHFNNMHHNGSCGYFFHFSSSCWK